MNNVKHLANLMCCELDECSSLFAEATRLWQGEPLCSSAKEEALCSTGKGEHQDIHGHAEGVEEEQEEKEGGGDKEQGDTRAQLLLPLPPSGTPEGSLSFFPPVGMRYDSHTSAHNCSLCRRRLV